MHTIALIDRLIAIEKAAARKDHAEVETLVIDAQNIALELERNLVDALHENARLQAMKVAFPAF